MGIHSRGCSKVLERVLSWLGCHESFQGAGESFRELYGFEIPVSTIRSVSLKHADQIQKQQQQETQTSYRAMPQQGVDQLIAQADGSMICTVPAGLKRDDKRPRQWKEVRLVCAQALGTEQVHYAASFDSIHQSGRQWGHCALQAGRGQSTAIHALGDGASWIRQQSQEVFGAESPFLLDFYHVSEYLASASETARPAQPGQWLRTQQKRLKKGRGDKVLKELQLYQEPETVPEELAPVRKALRYLSNREDQLFYDRAIEADLPIGSGTIESGHKHVLQKRMKKSGAAWLLESAESMAQARTCIVNGQWAQYWNSPEDLAA